MPYYVDTTRGRIYNTTEVPPDQLNQNAVYATFHEAFVALKEQAVPIKPAEEEEDKGVINNFLVGCDPEFMAFDEHGYRWNLHHILPARGEIGIDHGGRVGELRPAPAKGAYTLVKRLQKLIQDDKLKQFKKLRAGAMANDQPLGGHVHIDINPWTPGSFNTVPAPEHRLRIQALDNLTMRLEHLDILPAKECEARRKEGHYGQYSETRPQGTFANPRFEYRTMASWLYDPKAAFLCLTTAKLAAAEPQASFDLLLRKTQYPYRRLQEWVKAFESKDSDAAKLTAILDKGHKSLIADPEVDFRVKWEVLP